MNADSCKFIVETMSTSREERDAESRYFIHTSEHVAFKSTPTYQKRLPRNEKASHLKEMSVRSHGKIDHLPSFTPVSRFYPSSAYTTTQSTVV